MTNRFALSLKADTAGRWLWSFASAERTHTGAAAARNRDDAVVCALASASVDLLADGPVEVVLSLHESSRIWDIARELEQHFEGVALMAFSDADALLREAAQAALQPSVPVALIPAPRVPLGPLTVATDGSHARGRIGWGWLASDGSHGCATAAPHARECGKRGLTLLSELRAISAAIEANPNRSLAIRTDSVAAITIINTWLKGKDSMPADYVIEHHTATARGGLRWMQEQVRREAHRIDISWVRGHAGDSLNEGADSLAKLALRAAEGTWGFTPADVPERAKSIAEVFATDHRQSAAAA